jgi:hypothetical protein
MYTSTFPPPVLSSAPDPDPFGDPEEVDVDPVRVPETPLQVPTPQKQSFNPTLVAAAQSLPPILSALGIGGVRFLKGIIPVLAEWLALPFPIVTAEVGCVPNDNEETSPHNAEGTHDSDSSTTGVTLHIASLSSLSVLFRTCTPRIGGWSTTIVDAIGRCWVGCLDLESHRRDNTISKDSVCLLRKQLKETAVQLAEVYPGVIKVCPSVIVLIFLIFMFLLNGSHLLSFNLDYSLVLFLYSCFHCPFWILTSLYHRMSMPFYWLMMKLFLGT